ncbi:MAG TPA: hypothetical protein VMG11_09220 [Steroidobacteraceae bacterium]|nr:hypothetical protein [Steroidobacteraceae bacterium]
MSAWIDVADDLPCVDEIVEVWLAFGHGGSTQMRGYRLASRTGAEALWLNALTHEPFPEGWRVVRWKKASGESVGAAAATTDKRQH